MIWVHSFRWMSLYCLSPGWTDSHRIVSPILWYPHCPMSFHVYSLERLVISKMHYHLKSSELQKLRYRLFPKHHNVFDFSVLILNIMLDLYNLSRLPCVLIPSHWNIFWIWIIIYGLYNLFQKRAYWQISNLCLSSIHAKL